jgi:ATP-dependent DNA helicase RecG
MKMPVLKKFSNAEVDSIFTGVGKVISVRSLPSFKGRGKGKAQLLNISVIVKDHFSSRTLEIKWFNAYGSISQKFEKSEYIKFTGSIQEYQGAIQVVNPDFNEVLKEDLPVTEEREADLPALKIQYPTINGVNTANVKKVIDKIPSLLWTSIQDEIPNEIIEERKLISLDKAYYLIHGKREYLDTWNEDLFLRARDRLIYQELFDEQLKITLRKNKIKTKEGIVFKKLETKSINKLFPYELTQDQKKVVKEIIADTKSGHPMMRLVQGDVGCGKTSIAIIAGILTNLNGFQSAFMCPTESLANQHYNEIEEYCNSLGIQCSLLLGSTSNKRKKEILDQLESGQIQFIVGTHSLFQDSIKFKNLAMAIIDEQHKFGVEQRLKLVKKGKGCHCLIMTATPIPRSLSLTQFGDLDISTIKSMPSGRKGSKTRIVTSENFGNFLNFVKTRVTMQEQVYIVVPAITESPNQDILNLEDVKKRFKEFFPSMIIEGMHGQMKSDERNDILNSFKDKKVNILVSTSVIEVGINILNATVMAILNPERFGLSSLHQLRGRVGRGEKPGFCFLITEKMISNDSMTRLKVIEDYTDGFHIAEEDLKIRGAGDVFGKEQSGSQNTKKIANIILNNRELEYAKEDLANILSTYPQALKGKIKRLEKDVKLFSTV